MQLRTAKVSVAQSASRSRPSDLQRLGSCGEVLTLLGSPWLVGLTLGRAGDVAAIG